MKNIKKVLALLMASFMIALALPLTMLPAMADEPETTPASIKHVKLYAKYGDLWDVHAMYGDVEAITDGDPKPGYVDADKRSNYTYYQSDDLYDSITYYYLDSKGRLTLATEDEDKTYMGYAIFELNGVSALDDVTIWLAGDTAAEWKTPKTAWNMNDAYDILVSDDGKSWELLQEFAGMCGDGTNAGAGWTEQDGLGNIASITDASGYDKLGHQINLDGVEAKYFAIGVKHGMNSVKDSKVLNAIVFGEVTVNGTVVTPDAVEKTPAERYAEADDGDFLYRVNFKDTTWNDDYYDSYNWNTYYQISEDGTAVKHLIQKGKTFGADNKRAMWGGIVEDERFSLDNGETYTVFFDALFGSSAYNTYGIGIQVDGNNTLVIDGFGCSYWYEWNTQKVKKSDEGIYKWNYYTDTAKTEKQSFAVEVDSANEIMTLYIADSTGVYFKVREMTYDGANISDALVCRIYTTRVNADKTLDSKCWSEISDLTIYKGLVGGTLGHTYGEWIETKAPTCTEEGLKERVCSDCGAISTEKIPALGHTWGDWVVTKEASYTEEGIKTKTCADCGITITEAIPMLIYEPIDGDLLYTVDFRGDEVFKNPRSCWSGANVTKTETSMTMHTKKDTSFVNFRGSGWGADLQGYTILGKSYTVVFTLEASDINQEIGFLPDDHAGFVVTPGQNKFRFVSTRFNDYGTDAAYENVIVSGKYETAARSLKQTYAVEIKTAGTQENPDVVAYKLYVVDGNEWKLVCALTDEQMDNSYFDWFYFEDGVYEEDLAMRFYRRCYVLDEYGFAIDKIDELQNGTVTVSDAKLYQGLIATNALVEAPETEIVRPASSAVAYDDAEDGDLLYELNFNGDDIFSPRDGDGKWNKTDAVASADGKSVTVTYTDEVTIEPEEEDRKSWGRARYHGVLEGYSVIGNSYSLEFTVQSDVRVGIMLDGFNGFVVNPKDKYTWIGSYGNWAKIANWESYKDYAPCSDTNTETYVIEIAFSDTMSKDNNGADCYAPTLYKLYVKGADGKITLIREVESYATNMFDWEIDNGTEYFELDFSIIRYHSEQYDAPTTVSDVKLYKGIGLYEVKMPIIEDEELGGDSDDGNDETEGDNTPELHVHNYGAWIETKSATCTEDGVKTKTCVDCGNVITVAIPALGHNYGAWEFTDPTCAAAGAKTKTCVTCSDKVSETIPALGHNYGAWTESKAPTCTEDGVIEKKCIVCNDTLTDAIARGEHKYGEWTVTKEPTATEMGIETKKCEHCGDEITESIPKQKPTDTEDKAETEAKPEKETGLFGCGSSLAMASVALVGACAAVFALKRGKKED